MASAIVPEILSKDNYDDWSVCMKNYLRAQDLWDIIEGPNSKPPNQAVTEAEFKAWMKKNATALHAIQISCRPDIYSPVRKTDSAKTAWYTLLKNSFRNPFACASKGKINNEYNRVPKLFKYINQGDWHSVGNFIDEYPNVINAKITSDGQTPLHKATCEGKVEIVGKLVKLMSPEALAVQDVYGNTALHYAAARGMTRMARYMVEKNDTLVTIANNWGIIPTLYACAGGQRDMTAYLLTKTSFRSLSLGHASVLLQCAIVFNMFDLALELFNSFPSSATARDAFFNRSALGVLSVSPDLFPSGCQLGLWQRLIYFCIRIDVESLVPHDGDDQSNVDDNIIKQQGIRIDVEPLVSHDGDEQTRIDLDQSDFDDKIITKQVLGNLRRLCVNFLRFLGIKRIYDLKMTHAYSRELLRLICEHISKLDESTHEEIGIPEYFRNAVERGLVEMVSAISEASPYFSNTEDEDDRNPIMYSIVNRQEKVFNLFAKLPLCQSFIIDKFGNTLLHLAGMLSPASQLTRISGAALQMQRELQWYKEVESIVYPAAKFVSNQNGETPDQLFTKHHKQLVIEGEKWMKDTATSCTVVGALIITITFTAAFTVPGGNVQDKGIPLFLHKNAFMNFIISDTISLFASSTSVLMFLGILTSRYEEQDFLSSLPTKLIIGLSTLFISIATMMVAFCAALVLMLDGMMKVIIPIVLLASVPVTLFMFLQFPLLVKIAMSTYGPSIFNRKS